MDAVVNQALPALDEADLERRFGGLRRLYGDAAYARIRAARVATAYAAEPTTTPSAATMPIVRCLLASLKLSLIHISEPTRPY